MAVASAGPHAPCSRLITMPAPHQSSGTSGGKQKENCLTQVQQGTGHSNRCGSGGGVVLLNGTNEQAASDTHVWFSLVVEEFQWSGRCSSQ